MVLDPGSAGWSFMQDPPERKIAAKRFIGRLPATVGPCPECGCPATWSYPGDLLVSHHEDPLEHAACPAVIERERVRDMIVEGARSISMTDLLDEPMEYHNAIQRTVREVAARQRDAIEAELMALPPGYRLCMHDDPTALCEPPATFSASDTYTLRVRQRGHTLAPGEMCRFQGVGTRTEYGWPAGAIVQRLSPCGRLDDCRVIEAADGTRYWFRAHGCPVAELPPRRWSELDELAAQAHAPAAVATFADAADAALCNLLTGPIEPAEPVAYEQIVELFNRVMANRPDPYEWPLPAMRAALGGYAAIRPLWDPAKFLGSLGP